MQGRQHNASPVSYEYLHIPSEIYQTSAFPAAVVPNLLGNVNRGFSMHLYTDEQARQFMATHFGSAAAAAFEKLSGPNKGDMFRYAVLYVRGGLCLDIKTMGYTPLNLVFPNMTDKLTLYTVLSSVNSHGRWIHNGIIAAPPRHPLIWEQFHYTWGLASRRHQTHDTVLHMMASLQHYFGRLQYGGVYEARGMRLVLFQEECDRVLNHTNVNHSSPICRLTRHRDRYGKCCAIFGTNDTTKAPLFLTRDPTYPRGWDARMKQMGLQYTYASVSCTSDPDQPGCMTNQTAV